MSGRIHRSFIPFSPAPADVRFTSDWHIPGTRLKTERSEQIDRELEELAAKKEWR